MNSTNQDNQIRKIVIAGGGSAGWMTAAALAKIVSKEICQITLVESPAIGTVSVGEATIPQIRFFNSLLGLDENDFIKATKGTFKLGIEFVNWLKEGQSYMHPFGPYGSNMNGVPFHHYWLRSHEIGKSENILDYCVEGAAAKQNRFVRRINNAPPQLASVNYAFHFDAILYAKYLQKFAIAKGVNHFEGKIEKVNLKAENGFIQSLTIENGENIEGDLFIDCSGFNGRLIEQALNTGFEDWSHWLPCNKAVAQACEPEAEIRPYTISTARDAGWQWQIPLQHRIGNGHVFSSKYMSDDEATSVLQNNLPGKAIGEPRILSWKNGRRRKAWNKNCIAIGLAAGFLEPLESTGLQLVQSAISRLLSLFPDKSFRQADIDTYNQNTNFEIERIRDFIIAHYKLNQRQDSEFWLMCQQMEIPDTLKSKLALYQSSGRIFRENNELFNELSWFSVLNGQGMKPTSYHPLIESMSEKDLLSHLQNMRSTISGIVQSIPEHTQFIQRNCAAHLGP